MTKFLSLEELDKLRIYHLNVLKRVYINLYVYFLDDMKLCIGKINRASCVYKLIYWAN